MLDETQICWNESLRPVKLKLHFRISPFNQADSDQLDSLAVFVVWVRMVCYHFQVILNLTLRAHALYNCVVKKRISPLDTDYSFAPRATSAF